MNTTNAQQSAPTFRHKYRAELLLRRGLTLNAAAAELGMSPALLSNTLKRGPRACRVTTLIKLAAVVHATTDELLGWAD